ncbi:MAG TPA: LysE family translocator [Geminicoccaceae bacterium]|nr:LysE family translocator [Geminicoccaceae bacterium]
MPIELWLAFAVAATGLILMPGPTVLLVVGYAVSAGVRPALASMIGVALGDVTAMTVSFIGLGAVLATSAELFVAMKWLGAAYLIYLGVRLWRAPAVPPDRDPAVATRLPVLAMVGNAFAVTVLNPKSILFFAAFMPQFMDPGSPALPQMLLLGGTFVLIALSVLTVYVLTSGRVRQVVSTPSALRLFNRIGAGALIGAGVLTASLRRA